MDSATSVHGFPDVGCKMLCEGVSAAFCDAGISIYPYAASLSMLIGDICAGLAMTLQKTDIVMCFGHGGCSTGQLNEIQED